MTQDAINKSVVLLMALGISALFFTMIQQFLMALFLAGLFSALARPLFLRFQKLLKGRRRLASLLTMLFIAVVILIPLTLLIMILIGQALDVSQMITLRFREIVSYPEVLDAYIRQIPFYDQLQLNQAQIAQQAGTLATFLSRLLVEWVSSVTLGTANFIFMAFVFFYSMYFLQMDGIRLIEKFLYYLPLKTAEERMMLDKFTSVTRATLKGSLLIGLLQGALAGIAFAVAGIPNAVFWGSLMAILAAIPNIGAALVWIPAVVILLTQGKIAIGIGLALFCGLIVGSLDNVLRPILVGKDTRMHELLIFLSSLGGIVMFGLPGIFIGPVIASLFISIWELYSIEFADFLPAVHSLEDENNMPPCEQAASIDSPLRRFSSQWFNTIIQIIFQHLHNLRRNFFN
ncbi:AI-2E family transporter [Chromatium okenii]|uniref:AI-2E family transporter n=1 Tax=Chromatium okenii TaxID=61644 RepID=A0A2S7XRQ5_9GAMM|nr:AI-2E family transporter [Chromatium okenii]PQJ96233.1 AI-2E family transporter [Chromatium okenii]